MKFAIICNQSYCLIFFICLLTATDRSLLMYIFAEGAPFVCTIFLYVGRDSSVGIATRMSWTVPESNPGGDEIFRTRPDRPWVPLSLLYSGYRVFPRSKAAGAWRWPPTPISAQVEGRVELYICSPSGSSWPVMGWPLPLTFYGYAVLFSISFYACLQ